MYKPRTLPSCGCSKKSRTTTYVLIDRTHVVNDNTTPHSHSNISTLEVYGPITTSFNSAAHIVLTPKHNYGTHQTRCLEGTTTYAMYIVIAQL